MNLEGTITFLFMVGLWVFRSSLLALGKSEKKVQKAKGWFDKSETGQGPGEGFSAPTGQHIDLNNSEAEQEAQHQARPRPELPRQLGTGLLWFLLIITGALVVVNRLNTIPVRPEVRLAGASSLRGQTLITSYGCSSCHTIPGVSGAVGHVGPNLAAFSKRSYVAGSYPNTPELLTYWLQHPQQLKPGSAMPDLGLSTAEARDIAAYLYQLR